MNVQLPSFPKNTFKQNWKESPPELRVFFIFSILVFLANLVLQVSGLRELKESIIPFTGWNPGIGYFNYVMATFFIIIKINTKNLLLVRNLLILVLLLDIGLNAFELYRFGGSYESANPYLSISKYRYVWTMIVPAFWILVMFSPRIKRFCLR